MSGDYSDRELRSIKATVDGWYRAFAESPAFACLNQTQQGDAGAITEFFARYTYEYLGLSPDEWEPRAATECCVGILPRKVSADSDFFAMLAPVLSAFFQFLGDQALHRQGHALAKTVSALHRRIVAANKLLAASVAPTVQLSFVVLRHS